MNIRQQHNFRQPPAASPNSTRDLQEALDALEEKQHLVHEKLRELLATIDHAHPDEIMDQVLVLDRELRKYRRFFHILKNHFVTS